MSEPILYPEEDWLQLSGIQHFFFCRRQWGLIHLEMQWAENLRTVEGDLLHARVHDPAQRTRRGDLLTVRALRIHSARLGLSGECDVVEFRKSPDGVPLAETAGTWLPYPVEYKRGAPKQNICDEAQLCAQAMCLEEMLLCEIPEAAIYYGEPHRRQVIELTPELRNSVITAVGEMHMLYKRGHTPQVRPTRRCNACSLKDLCLPKLTHAEAVRDYMRREGGLDP